MPSRLLLAALVLVPLAGCPAPAEVEPATPDRPVYDATPDDLDEARQRWADAGLGAYTMTLQRICFCPSPDYTGPFEVDVADGAVTEVRLGGTPVDAERGESVEDLFELLEEAYAKDAERVEVTYDAALGYPTSISIDYSQMMADEEIAYRVSALTRADG